MKKSLVVSFVVLCVATLIPQSLPAAVGIKGAEAWSNLSFNYASPPPYSFSDREQVVFGGFFNVNFGYIGIQPEVLYVRMGAQYISGSDSLAYQYDYIQVPVLLKFNILPLGPIKPCVFAGPYGSALLSARRVSNIGGTHLDESIKSETNSTDYGLVFGGGVDFSLIAFKLSVDARYCLGMTNIDKLATGGDSLKNKAFMVMVGIGF